MTETGWLDCRDPGRMLEYLCGRRRPGDRRLRLFAVACARVFLRGGVPRATRQQLAAVLEVAERHAEGLVSDRELEAVRPTGAGTATWTVAEPLARDAAHLVAADGA